MSHSSVVEHTRADMLLVARGYAATRSQAQRLIEAGVQWRLPPQTWQVVRKNGERIPSYAEIYLQDAAELSFVSRGGVKLQAALRASNITAQDLRCLDVGQSTGGFTDCLLQYGAASVVGLDVGQGQLHPNLQTDTRVRSHQKINARDSQALAQVLENAYFDLIVGDVSFISLTLILPTISPYLAKNGRILMLVKPQFELQPHQIGKGGVVKDSSLYDWVQKRIYMCCQQLNLQPQQWLTSPILGGDGNREFFIVATPILRLDTNQ